MTQQQKTVLITGANRGIGFAIAKSLIQQGGFQLLLAARHQKDAEEAVSLLGSGIALRLDLTDPLLLEQKALQIEQQYGPVDVLINNAAMLHSTDVPHTRAEDLIHSLSVNTVAPFVLCKVFGLLMKQRGYGRIVNLSSGWGSFSEGLEGPACYAISKAALNAVTVSCARELMPEVKVNAVCPGWVRTRMGGEAADLSPEQGAETPVWLATLAEDGPTGAFFRNKTQIDW
ncbi:MAG: SDR family NAD(P)-dependent oxidoreductase [Gammaproteobacteria bacterium]|nr:SDR family NAD(P)-dependent oxidoreductase [Gammaproteobacteria bacterium]MBU2056284.1 SDR family NAD(P)-dependent oxidoreductase [Gammaproteobacteria bacterium]MBU2175758.1 SDR family NAD(P)-dependent oxidoreductase [Gammaproteobacteria bacterium]MBU2246610.1 SDR family NAD(P)-dependent oxidoreductase [Gammaproteobacteria bacterium]MBU2346396.1 SDR family NAD(P)-dependent oxidoreductase [Gammaproteobacteria bacterium]